MLPEKTHTATIGANGRIVIPAAIRKEFGWEEGQQITFTKNERGALEVSDAMRVWSELQALAEQCAKKLPQSAADMVREEREEELRLSEAKSTRSGSEHPS